MVLNLNPQAKTLYVNELNYHLQTEIYAEPTTSLSISF